MTGSGPKVQTAQDFVLALNHLETPIKNLTLAKSIHKPAQGAPGFTVSQLRRSLWQINPNLSCAA